MALWLVVLAAFLLLAALLPHLALLPSFRNEVSKPAAPRTHAPLPFVSIIVPARDEAHDLPRLLESLTRLEAVDHEVLVVDGGSRDGSRDVVRAFAARDARVRLLEEPPLPRGWIGKSWACRHGRRHARGEWLLFTDADTWHAPESLARAVADAQAHEADLLTGLTMQELRTFGERVHMPPVFTLIHAAIGGSGEARAQDPRLAIANGQYLLFRASAYDAVGGHDAVRESVVEDLALARLMARCGRRLRFVDLTALVRVRMYRSLRDMFDGWRKNVATGASHTPAMQYLATGLTQSAGLLALPVALVAGLRGDLFAAGVALSAFLVMSLRVRLAHRGAEGPALRHALLHPLGYAFFAAVLVASAWDRASGRGPRWKGRRYPGARSRRG